MRQIIKSQKEILKLKNKITEMKNATTVDLSRQRFGKLLDDRRDYLV